MRTTSDRTTWKPARGQRGGQRRLSRAGQPGDEHHARSQPRLLEFGQRHQPVAAGLDSRLVALGGGHFRLVHLETVDLSAHGRAIGNVKRQQRPAFVVARGAKIGLDERPCQIVAPPLLESHYQKGHVGHRIGKAIRVVEFDAVDNDHVARRLVVQQIDVSQPQVAVGIARHAARGAALDERPLLLELQLGERLQTLENAPADGHAKLRDRLREIVAGIGGHDFEAAASGDPRIALGPGMKVGDPLGQAGDDRYVDGAVRELVFERGLVAQAFHLDRPLDRLAGALEGDVLALPRYGHDVLVDSRRQAAIQTELFLAEVAALGERAEIEEAQRDGFLDLVGHRSGQEHERDVRLADFDRFDAERIGRRT